MNKLEKQKILLIGVEPNSLINFRVELIKEFEKSGKVVTTVSLPLSIDQEKDFSKRIINHVSILFQRNSLNPIADLRLLFSMSRLYRQQKPEAIFAYTIKPVIWGGLAARFQGVKFYALVTGLGFAFQGENFKRKLLTKFVSFLYKFALKDSKAVIFQNIDNRNVFVKKGIVELSKTHVVNGSGVDMEKYNVVDLPSNNSIVFLCVSRLLGEKGLREYAESAKIVKKKFPNVEFNLVGPEDSSLDSISLSEVSSWSDYISYKGSTNDVRPYIKDSHVYVLPSYHEGLPRSTLEAMSMGRPILTTNAVGCKDTVENGVNGFKVQVKSVDELSKKMIWFIEFSDQINKMGLESRKMVEDKFDVHKVNKEILKIMSIK
jgi:glycosyltransferase involved in cell wall biosynthesis